MRGSVTIVVVAFSTAAILAHLTPDQRLCVPDWRRYCSSTRTLEDATSCLMEHRDQLRRVCRDALTRNGR